MRKVLGFLAVILALSSASARATPLSAELITKVISFPLGGGFCNCYAHERLEASYSYTSPNGALASAPGGALTSAFLEYVPVPENGIPDAGTIAGVAVVNYYFEVNTPTSTLVPINLKGSASVATSSGDSEVTVNVFSQGTVHLADILCDSNGDCSQKVSFDQAINVLSNFPVLVSLRVNGSVYGLNAPVQSFGQADPTITIDPSYTGSATLAFSDFSAPNITDQSIGTRPVGAPPPLEPPSQPTTVAEPPTLLLVALPLLGILALRRRLLL